MAITIQQFAARQILTNYNESLLIEARFSDAVSIQGASDLTYLHLSNGGWAIYDADATAALNSDDTFVFRYTVAETDDSTPDLSVNGFYLGDAIINSTVTTVAIEDRDVYLIGATPDDLANDANLTLQDKIAIVGNTETNNDLVLPQARSVEVVSGNYLVGETVSFKVVFDEPVLVNSRNGTPTLTLTSDGEQLLDVFGVYSAGSGTQTLTFSFVVTETMNVADLQVGTILLNGGTILDGDGNSAGNGLGEVPVPGLADALYVSLGDQNPDAPDVVTYEPITIESVRYLDNDTEQFVVGDVLDLTVRTTGVVNVDTTEGVPTLVLKNGGFAAYQGGSGTNTLTFRYVVKPSDRDTLDLTVLGVAENDGAFVGSLGQNVDLRISSANNLSTFNDVEINARSPYISAIQSTSGVRSIGDSVEFLVKFSEPVDFEGDGSPNLSLSNGTTATYASQIDARTYKFIYTLQDGDADSSDLDVLSFNAEGVDVVSLADANDQVSLALGNITAVATTYDIEVDTTRPEGQISFDSSQVVAGETVGVTLTFAEPVTNPRSAITVSNGTLNTLVAVDGTELPRTVWKGVFIPSLGQEAEGVTLTLDNALVVDDSGNAGVGLSASNPLSIDTQGPIVSFSQEILFNNNRLFTIDFGEEVVDFDVSDLTITNGLRVTSGFTEVVPNRVYTLEVEPLADNPTGEVTVALRKGTVTDLLGNENSEQSFSRAWDVIPPQIVSVTAVDTTPYTVDETIRIAVKYDEKVKVDTSTGFRPFLALNNGQEASYISGSESDTLVFEYTVVENDQVDALDVLALVRNNSVITDFAGNAAKAQIEPGTNLADLRTVEIDSVAPVIVTITAAEDKLYLAGDEVDLTVQFSENVYVDFSNGSPILALSNGAVAEYVSGDESRYLKFKYVVQPNDFDTSDLDVHALIGNGALLKDISGNEVNPAILSNNSRLSYRSDVVVDAATPYFNTISVNAGNYQAGEIIDIALGWNKPVAMDDSLGTPELKLSNGEIAEFNAAASTPNRLVFSYTVRATDGEASQLTIDEFRANFARFTGVVAGESADLSLPNDGALADDQGGVQIDLSRPEVAQISLLDTDGSATLGAGELATLTVVFDAAVKELRPEFFNIENGSLGALSSDDGGVTWTGSFTPLKGTQAGEQSISLDMTKVSDLAGNYGLGASEEAAYTLDSAYPTVEIRSDLRGIAGEGDEVRIVINFSEAVQLRTVDVQTGEISYSAIAPSIPGTPEDFSWVNVLNGEIDLDSLETPDNSGRPEGEYSFVVIPNDNSTDPVKVRVADGAVADMAFNANLASNVLVQPVDTVNARIEGIETVAGAYAIGDTLALDVKFSEAVTLMDRADEPASDRVPTLTLSNGETATYVSGSGTDSWRFEYTFSEGDAQVRDLQVVTFLENDKLVVDQAGNLTQTQLGSSNRLQNTVIVDAEGPALVGFSAIEAQYNSAEVDPAQIGKYNTGDVVWIKMHTTEWVSVDTTAGRPTLALSNAGVASYVSGSYSNTLLFRYDVLDNHQSAAELAVNAVVMNGGVIADAAGNALDGNAFDASRIKSGSLTSANLVVVDTDAPVVQTISIVETTSSATGASAATDVANDGYYQAGTTIAFEVAFDSVINVDLNAVTQSQIGHEDYDGPVLTLSNGQLAYYIEGDGTDTLRFEYTVAEGDINSDDLEVLGLAEQGAVLTDDAGNPALVEMVSDKRNYTTAVVDTQAPELIAATDGFTANDDGEDVVKTLETVSFTFEFSEVMDWILATDQSIDPSDTAAIAQLVADNEADILAFFSVELTPANNAVAPRAYEDANGELLAMPAPTLTDAGWNTGLVAENFRFELNEHGELDLTRFSVEVQIPDLTYADLKVSIASDALGDFAQNLSESDLSHTQRVDTQSFELNPSIVLGLVVNSEAQIDLLDKAGNSLLEDGVVINIDPATGKASIVVSPSETYPAGYRGPVILEVRDEDSEPDYIDEYTGEAKDLDTVIRAMFNVTGPGAVDVTVSPLTELAVAKFFAINGDGAELDVATVDQYNAGIGAIFGLDDITATTPAVTNAAAVEAETGLDLLQPGEEGVSEASVKYGQVLAMLSARDSLSGSVAATLTELAEQIEPVVNIDGSAGFAIQQAGADLLVEALDASSSIEALDSVGVNRELIDLAYMDAAAASGFGLSLAEAETATLPIKGAQLGDTVFVRWGNIVGGDNDGQPNIFEVVIDASHIAEDGSVSVPVPIEVIELQGDANSIPVSFAIAANPTQTWQEADFSAPILVAVDIVPPVAEVAAPTQDAPLLVKGTIEGIRPGDNLNVLLNNSADESFKYSLDTSFLQIADGAVTIDSDLLPAGLVVTGATYNSVDGTVEFEWALDLTAAISVAAASTDDPQPTFVADDPRAVFEVQASTADLVGNPAESSSRNEFIIGSVDEILFADTADATEAANNRAVMNDLLDRLSARYGDAAVDTRDKIQTLAQAVKNLSALQTGDADAMVQAQQSLTVSTDGTLESAVFAINIGGDALSLDLSGVANPSVSDLVAAIQAQPGYSAKNYTVVADGNNVQVLYKSFGPQPDSTVQSTLTETVAASEITSTVVQSGDIASFAVQTIAPAGTVVESGFELSPGQVRLEFGDVVLSVDVSEGDLITDLLAQLQAADAYADLPFALTLAESGDSLVATWERVGEVTDTLSLNREYVQVTTSDLATFASSPEGTSGITTAQLEALDIQNVDDTQMGAINRVLADQLADTLGQATIVFTETALAAGESSVVTISFPERVGQLPDDVLELLGGNFTAAEGAPIWSSTDGINWTATFTASSTIVNTSLRYEKVLDSEGGEVLDASGNPTLQVIADTNNASGYAELGAADLMTVAVVEALVNKVTTASALIHAYSSAADAAEPGLEAFADVGLAEVRADNLSAVLDSLARVRDGFEVEGDLYAQIDSVASSYNKVFNTVYATGAQPSAAELEQAFKTIGVTNLSASRSADQVSLLQGVITSVANGQSAADQAALINTVAKIESYVATVDKVLSLADSSDVQSVAISDAELTQLGFGDLLADSAGNSRSAVLLKVLADQTSSAAVVQYANLETLLETAVYAFDVVVALTTTAQAQSDTSAALAAIDAATFSEMGVDGVADVAITGLTAADMALAVKDALANTGNTVTSLAAVQTLVDSYTAILATAQSGTPSFDEADLVNIGVELTSTAGAQAAQVAILQDFLATLSLSDVARLDDLQAEVDLVDRVLTRATGDTDIQVTDAEYVDLGIQGATAANLPALQKVLSDLGSVDSVSTLADLQSKLNTTVQAFADITAIAGQSSADTYALTATTFANMGIDALNDSRLAVTLSALKNTSSATTLANVQAAVDAINSLLDIADSDTGVVSADMLTAIGFTPVADQTAQTVQLTLVGDLVAAADESDFASVADISDLLALTTALFANVAGTADIAQSDLEDLGVSDITANNLSTLQAVLKQQTDMSAVSDLASLQNLMATAIATHAALLAVTGDADADTSAMDAQTFVDVGLDVTSGRESAVLSALKSTNETPTTGESIQAIFDSMETILDVAATDTGAIAATDLTKVGVTLRADNAQADLQAHLISEIVAGLDENDVSTVAQIAALTAVTGRLIGTINDETGVSLSENDMAVLGLTINASNLRLFNEAIGAETDLSNVEDLSEIAAIASSVMTAQTNALAKISAYIDDGITPPDVDDLREAGLELSDGSRITDQLMPALLQQLNAASGTYASFADIQGLITAGSAQLLALAAIAEYAQADGVDVAAPSLAQYQNAGITDFGSPAVTLEERHVAVANAILAHNSIGTDTGEDLATLTESAVQSLVDLVADPLPTVASIDSISMDTFDADNAGGSATDFITSYTGVQTISATLSAELKAWQLAEYRIDDGAWTQIADDFITGTAIAFGSTAFSSDDAYTLEIRVKDLSGEASAAATQAIVVDTTDPTAPAVVIPVVINDDAASVVEATASEGVITVQGGQGETLKVTLTSDASGSTSVTKTLSANDGSAQKLVLTTGDVNNLGTGTITVSVTSTDLAGNQATSSDIASFSLDADRPNQPTLSRDGNVLTIAGEDSAAVVLMDGSTDITDSFDIVESPAGTYTATAITDAFDGTETLSITAALTDAAGNLGYASAALAGTGILDTTAPDAPVLTAVVNSADAAYDAGFTVTENSDVVVTVDGTALTDTELAAYFTKTTASNIDTYTAVNAKFAGTETISVTAGFTDSFNNTTDVTVALQEVKPVTPTQTITFDSVAYTVAGTTETETDFIVNQTSGLTINATLSAELAAGHKLMYFNGAGQWVDVSSSVSGTSVSYLDPTLTQSAAITLKIRNAMGEETVPTGQPVVIDTVAPDAPSLAINGAVSGALTETEITSLNSTEGLYNVSAEEGTEITLTFTNGSNEVEKTLTATGVGQFVQLSSADLTQLTDGTIIVSVVATDNAGNVSTAATSSFVLDTAPPATTDAALTTDSGTANDGLTNSAAITAPTNAETQAVVEYRVLDADNSDAVVTDWSTSYIAPTTDGNYKVEVRQTDAAGNISTVQTITFEYDSTIPMPDAVITTDSGSSATDGITDTSGITAPTNTGSDTLQYRILNAADDSVVSDWSSTYTAPTIDGSYKVEVKHTDAAGNTATQTLNLTLDTAADLTVSVAAGTYGVGDSVAITLTSASGETGITFSVAKFNGSTLEGVTDNGDGTYSATYIVSAGDTEVAAGGDVTVDFQFTDVAGNSDSLTSVSLSNNVAITPAALALEAFEEFLNPSAPEVVDLGDTGQLILPVTVDGGRTYYLFDRNSDNSLTHQTSTPVAQRDYLNSAELANFIYDENGNASPNNTLSTTYRYGELSGVKLAIADLGTAYDGSAPYSEFYTSVSGNEDNPNYDGGMAAIIDSFNGLPQSWLDAGLTDFALAQTDYANSYAMSYVSNGGIIGATSNPEYMRLIIELIDVASAISADSIVRPTLQMYEAIEITTFNDGATDLTLTSELVALANEIVSGLSGTVTANAIQTALNTAHAKLTAMQVVLDYIDDQSSTAPDADDYNAIGLGRTVADAEVAALNAAAVSAGVTAADTPAELATLLPVPSVTIDAISDDTSAYPPMADLTVAVSTDPNGQQGDVLIDISSVQVGDYLTLELNGVSYTSEVAVPAPDSFFNLQNKILLAFRGGNPEPAGLTSWKTAVGIDEFYISGSQILARPTATNIDLSALSVKAGVAVTPDFITSDDDGLTITATLDAALATGQRLEFSTDGTNWTDISDSVTGTAVSYDASSLTSTATVQMRVVNTAGTAGTADSQLITIDTTVATPNATLAVDSTNGVSGNDSDAVTNSGAITAPANAESGAIVEYRVQKDAGAFSSWSETYTAPATDGSADGAYVVEVRQTDVAGNVSASQSLTFTLDITAPTTVVTAITISDDSGVQGDFITNDVDGLTISATLSAALATGEILEYWNGAAWSQVAATAISSTAVSFSDANLNSDTTVKFRVSDAAGNAGAEFTQAITFDTTAATPSITETTLYTNGSLAVSATEAGTIYLVDSSATVASESDIRALSDAAWNEVAATAAGTFSVAGTGLSAGNYKVYFVDAAGNITQIENSPVIVAEPPRVVSNIELRDNDGDYSNGTIYDAQRVTADIAGLKSTDSVYLKVGTAAEIDVTDYVSGGTLRYGNSATSISVDRGTAVDGFYTYSFNLVNGDQADRDYGAFDVYVADTTKQRSDGTYTDLSVETVQWRNYIYSGKVNVSNLQANDKVNAQVHIEEFIVPMGSDEYKAYLGGNTFVLWSQATAGQIDVTDVPAAPSGAVMLATVLGASGSVYEFELAEGTTTQTFALPNSDTVSSVEFGFLYKDIQPVNGEYLFDYNDQIYGYPDGVSATVVGADSEVYAKANTLMYPAVFTAIDADAVRAAASSTTSVDLTIQSTYGGSGLDLFVEGSKVADLVDQRFSVVDGDVIEVIVKDASGNEVSPATGNTITVDINIPVPSVLNVSTLASSEVLNVGSELEIDVLLNVGVTSGANSSFDLVLSNGALVHMSLVTGSTRFFTGTYTVAEGDTTTTNLQVSSIQATSGSTLPYNDTGTMTADISGFSISRNGTDYEVTDYVPPSIDTLILATDTGLFADDNVTSESYQYDATSGAIGGGLSPTLDDDDGYAVTLEATGQTYYSTPKWFPVTGGEYESGDETFRITSVSGDGSLDSFSALSSYGIELASPNQINLVGDSTVLTVGDVLTMSITPEGGSAIVLTATVGSYYNTVEDVLVDLLTSATSLTALRNAGFTIDEYDGSGVEDPNNVGTYLEDTNIKRNDGLAFTIELPAEFNGHVYAYDNRTYAETLNTSSSAYSVDNGSLDNDGSFEMTLYKTHLASVVTEGGAATAEDQTITLSLDNGSFNDVYRLGNALIGDIDSSWSFSSWTQLIERLNTWISESSVGQPMPTVMLSDPSNVETFGSNASAVLRFNWGSYTDFFISSISVNGTAATGSITLSSAGESDVVLSYSQLAGYLWGVNGTTSNPTASQTSLLEDILANLNSQLSGTPYYFMEINRDTITGATGSVDGIRLIRTDGAAFTVAGLDQVNSAVANDASVSVSSSYGAIDYTVNSFNRSYNSADEVVTETFDYSLDQTAATTPSVAVTGGDDTDADDGTLINNTIVSSYITGAAPGEYVYLIKSDQSTVFDYLSSDPQRALDNLRGLDAGLWQRSKVAEDGTVSLASNDLVDGVYKVVAMDLAGNFSEVAANTITVTNSTLSAAGDAHDVLFHAVDTDAVQSNSFDIGFTDPSTAAAKSGDSSVGIVLNIQDAAEGDMLEVYADGQLVWSHEVLGSEVGSQIWLSEKDLSTYDDATTANTGTTGDDKVLLELKVKHGDTYVQDSSEVTWEYQWA